MQLPGGAAAVTNTGDRATFRPILSTYGFFYVSHRSTATRDLGLYPAGTRC
jgi:hypothetical protein